MATLPRKIRIAAIALAGFSLSTQVLADEAEKALAGELLDCTAYYQISSEAIAAMNAPQMQAVGERLKQSAADSLALAGKYYGEGDLDAALKAARDKQIASMAGSSSLGNLMAKYKESCKTLTANPQARLEYWQMATM
ncbi:hypothetical protein KJI95_00090 [Shewanella sp. JM162201]|uniref:Lysozyme inhibitor LprI N-terminal domain-containing protein n=2 Tax=Shewanella jiangmenensis TaxID=2837387 RepID=A0ABS5UXZ2_9GAMM|nr:hypothetical protein [Shewanella jiangmenensis]MBT1442927.1 hypothetical protein [Shewanella jiangmenensis]